MATRAQVTTAITGALENQAGITYVTTDIENFTRVGNSQMPACYVNIETVSQVPVSYNHPTAHDRNAVVDVTVTGWVKKANASDIKGAVDDLYEAIHAAMESDSTLRGYVNNVELQSAVTEPSQADRVGSVTATYQIDYDYNHNSP